MQRSDEGVRMAQLKESTENYSVAVKIAELLLPLSCDRRKTVRRLVCEIIREEDTPV